MKRFFDKIDKTGGCWIWAGCLRGKSGYGAFKLNGKVLNAHRVSYMIHKGEISKGKNVCHSCDNRNCVNPDHLFLGTQSDNMVDCSEKGRLRTPNMNVEIKHPSHAAYKKGCRCRDCSQMHYASTKRWKEKIDSPERLTNLLSPALSGSE